LGWLQGQSRGAAHHSRVGQLPVIDLIWFSLAVKCTKERWASGQGVVQDYLKHLEKLRSDAAECRLISDLATDQQKRELFDRLAVHLKSLADQVEQEMLRMRPKGS
jgi:hypothetical protein